MGFVWRRGGCWGLLKRFGGGFRRPRGETCAAAGSRRRLDRASHGRNWGIGWMLARSGTAGEHTWSAPCREGSAGGMAGFGGCAS